MDGWGLVQSGGAGNRVLGHHERVSFFSLLSEPEPEPEVGQSYFANPADRPQNWLPGVVGVGVTLARTETTAVLLTVSGVYPHGIAMTIRALVHPDHVVDVPRPGRRRGPSAGFRFGMLWQDGSRVEHSEVWPPAPSASQGRFHLAMRGGSGGGLEWWWSLWLWPLPPREPVEVFCMWIERQLAETRTRVDLGPMVDAAGDAVQLWPLPPPPEEGGWHAYAPLQSE